MSTPVVLALAAWSIIGMLFAMAYKSRGFANISFWRLIAIVACCGPIVWATFLWYLGKGLVSVAFRPWTE